MMMHTFPFRRLALALAVPFLVAASCGEAVEEGELDDDGGNANAFYTACTDATTFGQVTVPEARCMCRAERDMGFGALEACLAAEQMSNGGSLCEDDLFVGYRSTCTLRLDDWNVCRERLLTFASCNAAENYLAANLDGCGALSQELTDCVARPLF
jgi:hypothetical protein